MSSYLEKEIAKDDLVFWDDVLESQANSYGKVELPYLAQQLKYHRPSKVLDIGTGNGSFLIRIAESFPDIKFVGIDHNEGLLKLGIDRIKQSGLKKR